MVMGLLALIVSIPILCLTVKTLWSLVTTGRGLFGSGEVNIKTGPYQYFAVLIIVISTLFFLSFCIWKTIVVTDWSEIRGGPCGIYCGQ